MKRMNLGCGPIRPEGWDHVDRCASGQRFVLMGGGESPARDAWDSLIDEHVLLEEYDIIVMHHVLNEIRWNGLMPALKNVRLMLREGGVLRVSVPDVIGAFEAWRHGDRGWFPTGDKAGGIDDRFCGYLSWFGTNVSHFTQGRLLNLGFEAGFEAQGGCPFGETTFGPPEITELDTREHESLYWEFVR